MHDCPIEEASRVSGWGVERIFREAYGIRFNDPVMTMVVRLVDDAVDAYEATGYIPPRVQNFIEEGRHVDRRQHQLTLIAAE